MMESATPTTSGQNPLRLLIVGRNSTQAEQCLGALQKAGMEVSSERVDSFDQLADRLTDAPVELVLSEWGLPDGDAQRVLVHMRECYQNLPLVFITDDGAATLGPDQEAFPATIDCVSRDDLGQLPAAVRRALEQGAKSREHQRAVQAWEDLATMIGDPLFVVAGGQLVFVNEAALRILGASEATELLGKSALSMFHPVDRDTLDAEIKRCRPESVPVVFAAHLQKLDGHSLEVNITARGSHWRDQEAVYLILRDASESKRVEATISSLAAFAQFNPNPVFEFSGEGSLIFFNEAAAEMAQSLGKESPQELIPEDAPMFVRTCLDSGQRKAPFETTLGGRTFAWSFFPVPKNNVVHCYVAEVTEHHKLEAQLRHSQKLQSLGRLASGVAHDFNNILTVIQGHIGLLRTSPGLNSAMNESLQQVSRAAERAGNLTGQLLVFSRKTAMHPSPLDFNEMLTHISMMLHRTLGEDIEYQFSYEAGLPSVHADRSMMEQIVMILAVNARDAMPRGGQLIIGTSRVQVSEEHAARVAQARAGEFVCLSVVDSGCGMDHVTMSRLFEPFFTTKEFGKGTGLGLAVVESIVQQHQGWIEVQSMVGQGSTFRIYFPPSAEIASDESSESTNLTARGGDETVLVVEDEPPVRWIVKNVLEQYGYRVLEAGNGVEALAVWHQHHDDIALLLTDMVMPVGLNGQELAEKFFEQKPELKVIYTSGYSAQAAGTDLALTDGVDFLQKPFDAVKLARTVRARLDHEGMA